MDRYSSIINVWNCDAAIAMEEEMVKKGITLLTSIHGDTLLWHVEPKDCLDILHEANTRHLTVQDMRMAA